MADLKEVIGALNDSTKRRLKRNRDVTTERQLVSHYKNNGGLRELVGDLNPAELCKSLTVQDKRELQAVVYGALAFPSQVGVFFSRDDLNKSKLTKLGSIMHRLCGWSTESFQQVTYDALIKMLNRFGVDVEETDLQRLRMDGNSAADRKVRLKRMFTD